MKWSNSYVWAKALKLVPYAHEAQMALPEALKAYAVEAFTWGDPVGNWDDYVIQTALKELATVGYMEFGDVSEDWV